jgi:hypothetical protein
MVLFLVHNNQKLKKNLKTMYSVSQLNDTLKTLQKVINLNGDTIYKQKQLILSQEQAIALHIFTVNELKANNIKKVQAYTELEEKFQRKNLDIPIQGEIKKFIDEKDSVNCLKLPAKLVFKDEFGWSNVSATILGISNKPIFHLDSLQVYSKSKIIFGSEYKKGLFGIFKKQEKTVIIKNENPYIVELSAINVYIPKDKKWFETKIFWFSLGFVPPVTYFMYKWLK